MNPGAEEPNVDEPITVEGGRAENEKPALSEAQAPLGRVIEVSVRGGFLGEDEWEELLDQLADHEDEPEAIDALRATLGRLVAYERALARNRPRPEPCINDRLDAAFDELNAGDIVALQAAGYTQSAGWALAHEKAASRRDAALPVVGACFYNEQDLENGVSGFGLHLSFGAFGKPDEANAAVQRAGLDVARRVVETLQRHGVPCTWDGTSGTRIAIEPFDWWRRVA